MTPVSPFLAGEAQWIWVPGFDDAAASGQLVLFRKTFDLPPEDFPLADVSGGGDNSSIPLHVSADTRYKLYLNGRLVSLGPCKSYLDHWYYETADIRPFLRPGRNVLAAAVLRFSSSFQGCTSMVRSPFPGLIVHCQVKNIPLHTNSTWRCAQEHAVHITDDAEWDYRLGPAFLNIGERVDARRLRRGWLDDDDDDHGEEEEEEENHSHGGGGWSAAVESTLRRKMSPMLDPRRLVARDIPPMTDAPARFDGVTKASGPLPADAWRRMLRGDGAVELAEGSYSVDIESKFLTTGYIDLECELEGPDSCGNNNNDGDDGSESDSAPAVTIDLLYSECYEAPMPDPDPGAAAAAAPGPPPRRSKGDRADHAGGELYGHADRYAPRRGGNRYTPFWWRTFRYVRLRVEVRRGQQKRGQEREEGEVSAAAATAPPKTLLRIGSLAYRSTHYPLAERTTVDFGVRGRESSSSSSSSSSNDTTDASNDDDNDNDNDDNDNDNDDNDDNASLLTSLWAVSLRTLRNCMHETYEDCPFYEQNQFAMDARTQALLTYAASRDDRLARKALREFHASRRPGAGGGGLVETHFPSPHRGLLIPTFSLFWVLMVHDHAEAFGEGGGLSSSSSSSFSPGREESAAERLARCKRQPAHRYMAAVDDVLAWFDRRLNHLGLVGRFGGGDDDDEEGGGGGGGAEFWAFVDWVPGWFTPGQKPSPILGVAVPPAYFSRGAATYHSLLYAYALRRAARLARFVGRGATAREYRARAGSLVRAVRAHCFGAESGFFLDGPGAGQGPGELSQHVQVMAVLAGCCRRRRRRRGGGDDDDDDNDDESSSSRSFPDAATLMRRAVLQRERHGLAPLSLAQGFYAFRAAAAAGRRVYAELWPALAGPWRAMLLSSRGGGGMNLTTWPESAGGSERSDCHAWSAVPLYEIARELLGFRLRSPAWLDRVYGGRERRDGGGGGGGGGGRGESGYDEGDGSDDSDDSNDSDDDEVPHEVSVAVREELLPPAGVRARFALGTHDSPDALDLEWDARGGLRLRCSRDLLVRVRTGGVWRTESLVGQPL